MTRIAFYAPIKPPDHPIASGDRLIARNTMAALEQAGYEVDLASRYIAYSKREATAILEQRKAGALVEADAIIARYRNHAPDLWLTYHPYCKAPDWIGPSVCRALDLPYVTLEAARTGQGFEDGGDRWAAWRAQAQAGIVTADRHLVFKPTDRTYLTELLGNDEKLFDIPPFIDAHEPAIGAATLPRHWRSGTPTLIAVGMMRPGKKLENFRLLARALEPLRGLNWNLLIVGDGPERDAIGDLFRPFSSDRLLFTGALSRDRVLAHMASSELFVWPGWREPIGMVYLEAQMMGVPVAALDSMGVPLVVRHGETGLLAAEDNLAAFTDNLATLISHPALRADLGLAAKASVRDRHSLAAASGLLKAALAPFVSTG